MRMANAVNYEELRYYLLRDPDCTKKAMQMLSTSTAAMMSAF